MRTLHTLALLVTFSAVVVALAEDKKFSNGEVVFTYPDDWRALPLPPPTAAAFNKGEDMTFTITKNTVEFPSSLNEAFVEYESQELRKQFPEATDFLTASVTHRTLGEILQVDFTQPAARSGRGNRPMRHRFYAVPAGLAVYRIYCVARADQFTRRYEPIFDKVIDSLVLSPAPPKADAR